MGTDVLVEAGVGRSTVEGRAVAVVTTHSSIWLLDQEAHEFCRLPAGTRIDDVMTVCVWRPYERLELDADTGAFALVDGTHIMRAWLAR